MRTQTHHHNPARSLRLIPICAMPAHNHKTSIDIDTYNDFDCITRAKIPSPQLRDSNCVGVCVSCYRRRQLYVLLWISLGTLMLLWPIVFASSLYSLGNAARKVLRPNLSSFRKISLLRCLCVCVKLWRLSALYMYMWLCVCVSCQVELDGDNPYQLVTRILVIERIKVICGLRFNSERERECLIYIWNII